MRYKFLLFSFFITSILQAQIDNEPIPATDIDEIQLSSGNSVVGKVVDIQTNKGLEAVSVQLFAHITDPYSHQVKDSLIAAMLSKTNGDFHFINVFAFDNLEVRISAVGYGDYSNIFKFSTIKDSAKTLVIHKDLGNIVLTRDHERLEAVTIIASRPAMRMGIDKKIFDVDKSLSAKGGTAVDVMKNIPSVSVDVDGNIELRNSSPTIFIDGRPTILTLDQIASDDIDRIELITNPSAKYDASSTGGIINIILKKNKRHGINGIVSLSGGFPERYSGNANLNLRQGKFNFFLSGSYHYSNNEGNGSSTRQNKTKGIVNNYFEQHSKSDRDRKFSSMRAGADFFMDNRNTFTLTQGFFKGRFNTDEDQNQQYLTRDKGLDHYGNRTSDSYFEFNRDYTQLLYTHKFPKEGKQIDVSVNASYGNVQSNADIKNSFYNPDGTLYDDINQVRNEGANDNNRITSKIDFVNPLGNDKKLEMGLRSYINNYTSYFNSFSVQGGLEKKLPLSNHYKYTESVQAAYVTYTGKLGSIGYQGGLRGEYSKFSGVLIDSAKKFGYEYPSAIKNIWDALFPSLYLSKKVNEKDEVQLNYSRRVRRPDFWQLNPFIDINDPLNIQQGNPKLKPEFTNSLEFNYSKNFQDNSNFLGAIYYRNTLGDITRYSDTLSQAQFQQLNNAAVDPNAILNTYINSNSVNRMGIELTLQQKVAKNFDVTPSANLGYRKVNANAGALNLSNEGFYWSSKLTANYKTDLENESSAFNKLGFQLTANYESPRVIPQGKRLRQYSADFAVRKDLFNKDKGSLTFSVNDIFNSERYGVIYDTEIFYQETYSRRHERSYRLTFSYKFGNSEFSLFKKKDDNHGRNDD
ncbi:MAG: outer membrane beta-barrel protein [Ginsengibacter sp.]